MPEGDTIYRTARVLEGVLAGQMVVAARGRPGGALLGKVVGQRVERVTSRGKHLLIEFSGGLTLHTHLRIHGSWHRYAHGQRWRGGPSRAVAVIEVPRAVAVCFDAPVVELLDTRAVRLHPALRTLGPDLLADDFTRQSLDAALRALRSPERAETPIGQALLDQRVAAGIGNVFRSEILFIERVDPFAPVPSLDEATLARLLISARRLLVANRDGPARATTPDLLGGQPGSGGPRARTGRLWVYGRTHRPCRRCGTPVESVVTAELPRRVYWCPSCQPARAAPSPLPQVRTI